MTQYSSSNPVTINYDNGQWHLQTSTPTDVPTLGDGDEIDLTVSGTLAATIQVCGEDVVWPTGWSAGTTASPWGPCYWSSLANGDNELSFTTSGDIPLNIKVKVTRTGDG